MSAFSEKGMDATSIQDITDKADLGKGTFYRHFSSKEEIMVAIIEDSCLRLIQAIDRVMVHVETIEEALEALLHAHLCFFQENRREFLLLFQGRLLLKLERDDLSGLEQPFMIYLSQIERQIATFMPSVSGTEKMGKIAYAVAGFVSGFLSFAMIGMTPQEISVNLEPFRKAFVAGCLTMLAESNDTCHLHTQYSSNQQDDHHTVYKENKKDADKFQLP